MDRLTTSPDPIFRQIVATIRGRISSGELRPGHRVPSTRQIMREWGVAMATASKVLTVLRHEGLVRAVPGIGTVVDAGEAAPRSRPPRSVRGRDLDPLGRDRIVQVAIAVADADGLSALSMRRIATKLGVPTMSLYRYVDGKDALVILMADAAFGEFALPEEPAESGWRARLELAARLQWAIYLRHPWLAQVMSITRPLLAPNAIAHAEWTLRALDGLGLDADAMFHVHVTIANYVRGTAVNLAPEADAEQDTGETDEEWRNAQNARMAQILASGAFPTFSRITVEQPEFHLNLETLMEFGLQRLLDGVEKLLTVHHDGGASCG